MRRIDTRGVAVLWMGLWALMGWGCASAPRQQTLAALEGTGASAGLETQQIAGELFTLVALVPSRAQSTVLRVYIEGDGLAWRTRHRLSAHPTPVVPVALNLMLLDPTADKAYLARPCQYLQTEACHPRYWSTHPFSEPVIAEMSRALDALKSTGGYARLELVGFSGGGAVAALVSARRTDVDGLMTVAGNLDTKALCRLHGLTPLTDSLNPADVAEELRHIPQRHFIGTADTVIPVAVYASFAAHMKTAPDDPPILVEDATHLAGWEAQWPSLLRDHGFARPENQ